MKTFGDSPLGNFPLDPTVPLLVTGCLWSSSLYDVGVSQVIPAFFLAYIPWVLYRRWQHSDRQEFPLLSVITGMYWLAYALPLFWSAREVSSDAGPHFVSDLAITKSMYLAVEGALALCVGAMLYRRIRGSLTVRVDIPNRRAYRRYLGAVLIAALMLRIWVPIGALGNGARQLLSNIETVVPSLAFGLLLRYWIRKEATRWDKFLVASYLIASVVLGLASGWLGSVVSIGIVCAAVFGYERRKLPVLVFAAVLPAILFFQPAKEVFRARYWYSSSNGTISERLWFWVDESWRVWSQAIDEPGTESIKILADRSLDRLSLFQQTANVVDLTPDAVPYQYLRLYSYLGVTFIPRFIWEDKPSVNEANAWYQVSYHLTAPRNLEGVSIAVGTLTESYISFGWFGPLLVMVPLGIALAAYQRFFLRSGAGVVLSTIGAVLIPQFLSIESQLAQYLAGSAQQIAVALLVLLPVLYVSKFARTGRQHSRTIRFIRPRFRIPATGSMENGS